MEYYKNMICVTMQELTREDDGAPIMSKSNYNYHVRTGKINRVRLGGGMGNFALIEYASLPDRFKNHFVEKYGEPAEQIKESVMPDRLIIDTQARDFFAGYILSNGSYLPVEKIKEYTINASVLNELIRMLSERAALRRALGGKASNLWETILGTVERLREQEGHTLPDAPSTLKSKIKKYEAQGYESLISGKFGNVNTLKITEEAGRQIIALKRSKVPVYNNDQIFNEFNRIAQEKGWKPLKSINSLLQFLNRPDIEPLWYDAVHGELAAHQRYSRKHKTKLPQMRDSIWYGDGTKLNLYYKAIDHNGRWAIRTTQVYEVMDAYSETFLGYHISDSENFEAQYRAYRMAIETAKCRPFEVVTDNQGGHKKLEASRFFEGISRVSRRTAPYSGQSKTIESAFGRFQSQILHQDWRFTGMNITAKRAESRPNLEFIEANKESLYTFEELLVAYAEARQAWNNAPHPHTGRPRIEMYQTSVNPETESVNALDMVELFWITTDKPSTFTSKGITIEVNKQKYTYEVLDANKQPDLDFRENNTLRQFYVMYDPLDMSMVRLYIKDKSGLRFVTNAHPYVEIHRAIQEQEKGEMSFIQNMRIETNQRRIQRQIKAAELEMEHGVAPEQHGLNRPRIKGISAEAFELIGINTTNTTRKERTPKETVSIGEMTKMLSKS